jgi:dTMP kinase
VHSVIKPALNEGVIVVCDRFYDSTTAYQGAGRGAAELAWIREFNMRVTGGLKPDRTYLLEVPPSVARERMRQKEPDRMELADNAFYERVAETYELLAAEETLRFKRIDASRTAHDIHETVWNDLIERLDFPDSP